MNITNIKIHVTINPAALARYRSALSDPDFVWRKKTKSFITFTNQTFTYVRVFFHRLCEYYRHKTMGGTIIRFVISGNTSQIREK